MLCLKRLCACTLLVSVAVVSVAYAQIDPDSIGEGTCVGYVPHPADTVKDTSFHCGDTLHFARDDFIVKPCPDDRVEAAIPSVKTTVRIVAGDGFAHGKVIQIFRNPFDLPFEATYTFPLPHDGAVHGMKFRTSTGVFRADLKELEEAKEEYEKAKQEGKQASLLMQGQDNIFVQKLCNIPAGDSVTVEITFSMAVAYDMGSFELAFPTVVGPRFDPGTSPTGGGDLNPSYLPPATRSASTLDFSVLLLTPYEISNITSPHHDVSILSTGMKSKLRNLGMLEGGEELPEGLSPHLVLLNATGAIPNRDIVVRYKRADTGRELSVLSWHNGEQGYFAMQIYPDLVDTTGADLPVDMIFVLDVSGSMHGTPLARLKEIMRAMLDKARPVDRLSFIAFNNSTSNFHETPVEATSENITEARKWIDNLRASGGTRMQAGVTKGLSTPLDGNRIRIMSLITDGYIGDVHSIYREIEDDPAGTVAFTFGVGSSVNRELMDAAATAGDGIAKTILPGDDVEAIVSNFWTRIRTPQVSNIGIGWGGDVSDLTMDFPTSLWYGQPLKVFGTYTEGGPRILTLTGKSDNGTITESYPCRFVTGSKLVESVPKMWAREVIENLMNEQAGDSREPNKEEILRISLAYDVLCKYSAFIAVADSVVNENGEMVAMEVPVPVPEGVDPHMSGASEEVYDARQGTFGPSSAPAGVSVNRKPHTTVEARMVVVRTEESRLVFRLENVTDPNTLIRIYDFNGRLVRSWTFAELASQGFVWTWDFTDRQGVAVARGCYMLRINSENLTIHRVLVAR